MVEAAQQLSVVFWFSSQHFCRDCCFFTALLLLQLDKWL